MRTQSLRDLELPDLDADELDVGLEDVMMGSVPLSLKKGTIDEKYGDDGGEKTRNA